MRIEFLTCISVIVLIILGCSGNPASPGIQDPVSGGADRDITSGSNHACFGYYTIGIDTRSYEIEVSPMRIAGLHLNVTGIMNNTMGVSVVGIPSEHIPSQGIFTFDITLKHPFATKPQLTGFDVKGILIIPGNITFSGFTAPNSGLLNADGYSRWWNPTEFTQPGMFGYIQGNYANKPPAVLTSEINPYKYFADVLSSTGDMSEVYTLDTDDPGGRGMFSAGASNTRRYRLKFPVDPYPVIEYGYAVDAAWAQPTVKPPIDLPNDFPIEANQPEAFLVDLEVTANTLSFDYDSGNTGGVLRLKATVRDWQGILSTDTVAECGPVKLYVPYYIPNGVDPDTATNFWDRAEYEFDLTGDVIPDSVLPVYAMVEVKSAGGETYDQGLGIPAPTDVVGAWDAAICPVIEPPCEADSNIGFQSAGEMGINESVTGFLCSGTDNADFYRFHIPHDEKCIGGKFYANGWLDDFTLLLFDDDYHLITSTTYGQDLEIDAGTQDLDSGYYYLAVTTSGTSGIAGQYFLETDLDTEPLGSLQPQDISMGFSDLGATWAKISGDYLLMAGPTGVWVFNVVDPSDPVQVYRSYEKVSGDPAFYSPYMYFLSIGTDSRLHMIDFTDPASPVNHNEIIIFSESNDLITMSNQDLYLYEKETDDIYVWNYSADPVLPQWLATIDGFDGIREMKCIAPATTYTSLLMMSSDFFALYDVEDPENAVQKGYELLFDAVNMDFDIMGESIIKVHQEPVSDHFKVFHMDPTAHNLVFDGEELLSEEPAKVTAYTSKAYVTAENSDNILIVSTSDPTNPSETGSFDPACHIVAFDALSNKLACASEHSGLRIYDISGGGVPPYLGGMGTLNNPVVGTINGDIGYFADKHGASTTLHSVDLSNAGWPALISEHEYDYDINDIVTAFNGIYVLVDGNYSIDVFENPGGGILHWLSSKAQMDAPTAAVTRGGFMYVAFASGGYMKTYDVSMPSLVIEIGSEPVQTPVTDLALRGYTLYGISNDTITVYDITNLQHPVEKPGYAATGYVLNSLEVRDGYLMVSTTTDLLVLDITEPEDPVLVATLAIPGPPDIQSMALDGVYLFSCNGEDHPFATDISLPDMPTGFSEPFLSEPVTAINNILANDGYLFELTEGAGIRTWRLYQ